VSVGSVLLSTIFVWMGCGKSIEEDSIGAIFVVRWVISSSSVDKGVNYALDRLWLRG
jgi:hypothetical protein